MDKPVFLIGKSYDNDLVLDDQTVSRSHCEVIRDGRGYLLRDLGSTNGTLLDGAEVREVYLKAGAVITVGKVELKVRAFSERIEMLASSATRFGSLCGVTKSMREIFGLLERVASTDAALAIVGEPGSGRYTVALNVHRKSKRADAPFVVVDCAELGALSGDALEARFFGEAGALACAHQGSLLLQNIEQLPMDVQPRLARAFESGSFKRGADAIELDARLMSTSYVPLAQLVDTERLQKEITKCLMGVPVALPPLRDRLDDLPLLIESLLAQISTARKGPDYTAAEEVLVGLGASDWPGNIEELRFVLTRAVSLAQEDAQTMLTSAHVPRAGQTSPSVPVFDPARSYRESKAEWDAVFERHYVSWLLDRHSGNISAASRAADMDRKYLHKLAKKHSLHPSDRKKKKKN